MIKNKTSDDRSYIMADVGITRTCATYFISEYFRIFLLAFASSYSHCRALSSKVFSVVVMRG